MSDKITPEVAGEALRRVLIFLKEATELDRWFVEQNLDPYGADYGKPLADLMIDIYTLKARCKSIKRKVAGNNTAASPVASGEHFDVDDPEAAR